MRSLTHLLAAAALMAGSAGPALATAPTSSPTPQGQESWVDYDALEFGDAAGRRAVTYELEVSDRGRAKACRIVESSGDKEFDKSLCAQLRKNARFQRASASMFQSGSSYFRAYFYADPPTRGAG